MFILFFLNVNLTNIFSLETLLGSAFPQSFYEPVPGSGLYRVNEPQIHADFLNFQWSDVVVSVRNDRIVMVHYLWFGNTLSAVNINNLIENLINELTLNGYNINEHDRSNLNNRHNTESTNRILNAHNENDSFRIIWLTVGTEDRLVISRMYI